MTDPAGAPPASEPAPGAVISARHLTKTYQLGEHAVHALRDVSFDIQRGEFVAIMGPSGSGKSTLMNLIGALDTPTSGELSINGAAVSSLDKDQLADLRNRTIGFVFQQFNLLARTSALNNVKLPLSYSRDPAKQARGDELAAQRLQDVGLGNRMDHVPSQLSGGQQQRVAIARALVNSPSLILADEPTGALDSETSLEIMNLFRRLTESGMTVVLVTHEPDVAAHAKRLLRVRDGRIVEDRPTAEGSL
ncbi:MAG: ABC transporter ATP-binding protein [Gammaproteobacteria bacterium]|nr:ABC transporter ATP-binding protein [Gammaproteobacteria bacterium]